MIHMYVADKRVSTSEKNLRVSERPAVIVGGFKFLRDWKPTRLLEFRNRP